MNATKLCSVIDCEKSGRLRRSMCEMHYRRWLKHGDPLATKQFDTPEESFAARTEWRDDCLVWTGGKSHNGYGLITVNGNSVRAHRYAWEKDNGQIPSGKILKHTCHNRDCVNTKHLRIVTHQQNSANRSGPEQRNAESGLRNVYKSGSGWMVRLGKDGRRHYFGTYTTIEEANHVAERARQKLFGEYAGRG